VIASKSLRVMEVGTEKEARGDNVSHSQSSLGLRIRVASFAGVHRAAMDATLGVWTMSIPMSTIPIPSRPESGRLSLVRMRTVAKNTSSCDSVLLQASYSVGGSSLPTR
jgi:hypothetical protein